MSGAESSAAPRAARWGERVERVAQLPPVRALRRLVVGEDAEGELRVVDAARTTGGLRVRAPVLVLGFCTALAGGQWGFGWKGLVPGALIGWAVGARIYQGAVGYTLPDRLTRRGGLSRAVLTVAGRNLHTWTSYPGLDPESRANISSANATAAFDQAVLPTLAQFVTSLTLTF